MSDLLKLTFRQIVEATNFQLIMFGQRSTKWVSCFGVLDKNSKAGEFFIMRLDADFGGFRVKTLNKARTNLGRVQLSQSMVRKAEVKLARDYYEYLRLVTDYNSVDDLVQLGLAQVNICKRQYGIADHSVFRAYIPNALEKTSIETALVEAVNNAPKDKLAAIYDESNRIIIEIERYATSIE